ncbi:unnamed protein product [Cylindrotheca closterium]|nr:unnamed protein product [Cylindrotheca closterium]
MMKQIDTPPVFLSAGCFCRCRHLQRHCSSQQSVGQLVTTRFDDYPIHRLCYYSSVTKADDLHRQLGLSPYCQESIGTTLEELRQGDKCQQFVVDTFEMTPFHILLSSSTKRKDLLIALLDAYPAHVLGRQDIRGNRAMDYLNCKLWTDSVKALMQLTLERYTVDRLSDWGCDEWSRRMSSEVLAILRENDKERRENALNETYDTMTQYERLESVSVLELALWKSSMGPCRVDEDIGDGVGRNNGRVRCGASFVVPSVLTFLWD